jgi:hypothetical protein
VALGVAHNIDAWLQLEDRNSRLEGKIKHLWSQKDFTDYIGIGVAAKSRIQRSVTFGRQFFKP